MDGAESVPTRACASQAWNVGRAGWGWIRGVPRHAEGCYTYFDSRGKANIWFMREIAMEKRDMDYNIENEPGNKNRWIYDTKNKCDAAICITADYWRRNKNMGKFCTRHSVGCFLMDDTSSWVLINAHLLTTWAEHKDFTTRWRAAASRP